MPRVAPAQLAAATAFASSRGKGSKVSAGTEPVRLRILTAALAFVVGFPGTIGVVSFLAAMSRSGTSDGAFPLAVGTLALAGVLLVTGLGSVLRVGRDDITVRFFGVRSSSVRFDELKSATFGMAFPSISFAITLTGRTGRKALVHANWWRGETAAVVPVCRAILENEVPMDRSTARIVSEVLSVKRPPAQIIHHGLIKKDTTW